MAQVESYNPERSPEFVEGRSRREKIMAEGSVNSEAAPVASQAASGEIKPPIPGMPQELFDTLRQRHSLETIQKQRARYKTHEEFLADAEKEAEHIRATQNLQNLPLSPGQVVNGKVVDEAVLRNAELEDEARAQAAAELLYGKGKEFTEKQKQELIDAHLEASTEKGLNEEYLAGVYNLKPEQIRRKVEKLPSFTQEERRKLFEAGLVGAFEKLRAAAKKSKLKKDIEAVTYAEEVGQAFIASDAEIAKLVTESTEAVEKVLYPKTEAEQKELECVLYFVTDDISRVYTEAISEAPKAESDWGSSPRVKTQEEKIEDVHKGLDNYKETFWNYGEGVFKRIFEERGLPAPDIAALREKYGSIASFLASRAGIAIEKELKRIKPPISQDLEEELIRMPKVERWKAFRNDPELKERFERIENIGDFYLIDIKGELLATRGARERDRREKRKRATANERLHYSDWRERFDFTWAETSDELGASIDDWLDYFQHALPKEIEESMYQEVQKGLTNVLSAYEKARNRIGLDAASVVAEALRERIVGRVTTIAGSKLVETKKGMEYFIKLKRDIAANYNGYNDGIYLSEGSAIMADKLSENDGEIYWGGPRHIKKPLSGDTEAHRERLKREAIKYGATHQLYITKDDFENAELGEADIRRKVLQDVMAYNLNPENKQKMTTQDVEMVVKQRMDDKRDNKDRGGRYEWEDPIEELLLTDSRGTDAAKVKLRTSVFKEIKEMLDKADVATEAEKARGVTGNLFNLSPGERRDRIRERIKDKLKELHFDSLLEEIEDITDQTEQDKALWKWVEEYNRLKLEMKPEASDAAPWFPSLWDEERLSINRPEMLVDRALSEDQFRAMVEKIDDPFEGLTDKQIDKQIRKEFDAGIQREVQAKNLSPDEAQKEYKRLLAEREKDIKDKINSELFKRKERLTRAIRNFNINVADDKFKGLEARWGGLTTRVVNKETGELELTTIYLEVEKILAAKKNKEKQEVEDKVKEWEKGYLATHPGLTSQELATKEAAWRTEFQTNNPDLMAAQYNKAVEVWRIGFKAAYGKTEDEMKELRITQRRLFRRNCTFAATLGLEEIGIAEDLPVVNYFYYGDVSQIGAFAPLVGYTDDDKGDLPELLDRPRREAEAVWYFMGQQHMDGRILDVVDRDPGMVVEDKNGKRKPAHEERWVRPRVINAGGVLKLRDIFENMFMISTSGGVEVTNLASKIGRLGVEDEIYENGGRNKRESQGFRKRRCKWELRQQSFFNTREWADPLTHVDRLAGAAEARKFLLGGEVQGQGQVIGTLIEPMSGAYKYRDMFYDRNIWLEGSTVKSKLTMSDEKLKENVMAELAKSDNAKQINPKDLDKLVEIGAGIMKPLIDYMNARKYLMNRAGLAPKNWKYDNELIVNAYFNELLFNEEVMGEKDLGYAPQGRSPVAVSIFREILKTSTYHILVQKDHEELYPRAEETKLRMDKQRRDSVVAILPEGVQKLLNDKKDAEGKIVKKGAITEALEELQKQKPPLSKIKIEEKLNDVVNQALNKELHEQLQISDPANNPIKLNLPSDILKMINKRWEVLLKKRVQYKTSKEKGYKGLEGIDNKEAELKRVLDQYIDTKLHMEFVGEWPARLLVS